MVPLSFKCIQVYSSVSKCMQVYSSLDSNFTLELLMLMCGPADAITTLATLNRWFVTVPLSLKYIQVYSS
jgi:hypothetical protein